MSIVRRMGEQMEGELSEEIVIVSGVCVCVYVLIGCLVTRVCEPRVSCFSAARTRPERAGLPAIRLKSRVGTGSDRADGEEGVQRFSFGLTDFNLYYGIP